MLLSQFYLSLWIWQFYYDMSQCGSLWVYPACSSLRYLKLYIHDFPKIWKIFSLYFLAFCPFHSLFPFWNSYKHTVVCLMGLHKSVKFCSFSSFFYFCFFGKIILIVLSSDSMVLSSTCSDLLPNTSGEFFHLSYWTFQF